MPPVGNSIACYMYICVWAAHIRSHVRPYSKGHSESYYHKYQ